MVHSAYGYQKENQEKAKQEESSSEKEAPEEGHGKENHAEKSCCASEASDQESGGQESSCHQSWQRQNNPLTQENRARQKRNRRYGGVLARRTGRALRRAGPRSTGPFQ